MTVFSNLIITSLNAYTRLTFNTPAPSQIPTRTQFVIIAFNAIIYIFNKRTQERYQDAPDMSETREVYIKNEVLSNQAIR